MLLLCALIIGSVSSAWAQVTSAEPKDGGEYVVAAYVNSKYYALPNGLVNGATIAGKEITLNALGKVDTENATGKTWTLTENETILGQFYLSYTNNESTYYLYKNGTGKTNYNFKVSEGSKNYWKFETNEKGYSVSAVDRGTNNINVNYAGGTFSCKAAATPIFLLEIGDVPSSPLASIALSGSYKTSFYDDEDFSYDGLIVTATLENGTSFPVTPTNVSSPDFSTTGVKTITVSYTLNAVTKTATYEITVSSRPKFTVSFSDGGFLTESASGGGIVLPNRSNTGVYTFVGWSESNILPGTTSVTIENAGDTYYPEANITLYPVYSYNSQGVVNGWFEVTGVPEEGDYVICSNNNYALKASISSSRFANTDVTIIAGSPAMLSDEPDANCIWNIYKATDNYYRLMNNSKFAGATGSNNQGAMLDKEDSDYAEWTISYSTEFVIKNVDMETNSKNCTLRNNGSYGWGTYASGTGEAPRLFKKGAINKTVTLYTSNPIGTATITISPLCTDGEGSYYGTFSSTSAFIVPEGMKVSEISLLYNKLYVENYNEGDVVPANTGVMVAVDVAGDNTVSLSNETGTSVLGAENMLKASSVAMAGENLFYRLTMHNGTDLGFYWGAADGAAFSIDANKAYLAVPKTAGARIAGFKLFENEGEATAIEGVKTIDMDAPVFNLNGQRVNGNAKGLLIKNGKKFMNR